MLIHYVVELGKLLVIQILLNFLLGFIFLFLTIFLAFECHSLKFSVNKYSFLLVLSNALSYLVTINMLVKHVVVLGIEMSKLLLLRLQHQFRSDLVISWQHVSCKKLLYVFLTCEHALWLRFSRVGTYLTLFNIFWNLWFFNFYFCFWFYLIFSGDPQ